MSTAHRIDVHQHVVPRFWAKELPTHGGDPSGTVIPQWSPQSAIDMMDSQEVATGILSLTAPGVTRWYKIERREMARRVNEYTADLVAKRPGRFGNFATLPLPDVDGAVRELEYALDTLRADGVILLANYGQKYLGDAAFEPLWAVLHRRQAVVFVHPGQPPLPTVQGVAGPLVDYPFDTTRAAVQLVLNGILERYPGMRIILAHAGGFLPYASHRFAELARVFRPDAARPDDILASFQRCHRARRLCPASRRSPGVTEFCSAATSPMCPPASLHPSPASWTPTTTSPTTITGRSTMEMHGRYFRVSPQSTTGRLKERPTGAAIEQLLKRDTEC
jgi:6-methylsalicylate decarboxylase